MVAIDKEIKNHLVMTATTTAGSIGGIVVANNMGLKGTQKTIAIAAGSFVGLIAGVAFGVIKGRESSTDGQ